MYLKIASRGVMDIKALTKLGGSTKRNDSEKIGFFGSGNKYTLACLMREKVPLNIYCGLKHIPITLSSDMFGQTELHSICIDGRETDITTAFGPQWKLWMAIRELYSNALDEGDAQLKLVEEIEPNENETHFYLSVTPDLQNIMDNISDYFSEFKSGLIAYDPKCGEIFNKVAISRNATYRKGIKCWEDSIASVFDYNVYDISINESRIITNRYDLYNKIVKLWAEIPVEQEHIVKLLKSFRLEKTLESSAFSWSCTNVTFGDSWKFLKDYSLCPIKFQEIIEADYYVPMELISALKYCKIEFKSAVTTDDSASYIETKDGFMDAIVDKAEHFLKECNYPINVNATIGKFLDDDVYMTIKNRSLRQVVLSHNVVEKGAKETVMLLIRANAALDGHSLRNYYDKLAEHMLLYLQRKNAYIL